MSMKREQQIVYYIYNYNYIYNKSHFPILHMLPVETVFCIFCIQTEGEIHSVGFFNTKRGVSRVKTAKNLDSAKICSIFALSKRRGEIYGLPNAENFLR